MKILCLSINLNKIKSRDVSDKFKSILGFKIENITFKRNDFKIESRGYRNPSVSLHLEKERKVELRLKYNPE